MVCEFLFCFELSQAIGTLLRNKYKMILELVLGYFIKFTSATSTHFMYFMWLKIIKFFKLLPNLEN
jgi:hypothetical protein